MTQEHSIKIADKETLVDSRFIEPKDAETLTEAAKVERKIGWLEQISEDPDGYEDEKGNSFTQVQVLASLDKATRNKENSKILAKAETIRIAALARQSEVIDAGLKALNACRDEAT